jgi:hypothetical protein
VVTQDENKKKKEDEKKSKQLSISHELYQEIMTNIWGIFEKKQ